MPENWNAGLNIIVESEAAVDAEVGAGSPFVQIADGWSDPLAYVTCKSCYQGLVLTFASPLSVGSSGCGQD